MKAAPWTEAHQREALRRTYELAAELAGRGMVDEAFELCEVPRNMARSVASWRASLGCGFDAVRVKREVRRVRALAERRLVRETVTFYVVPQSDHDVVSVHREAVESRAQQADTPVRTIRVTRIRRAR